MRHPRILIQLDSDHHPSVFDAVVAVDAEVEHLLQYGQVAPDNVVALVHGAMFTRGPDQLKNSAIFVGGSDVHLGDAIGDNIRKAFFGPMRVSVMLDGNGCNTTAAAAVLSAARHVDLSRTRALVLGGTGPVGGRVARLLLRAGANVQLASRNLAKAKSACERLGEQAGLSVSDRLQPLDTSHPESLEPSLEAATTIFGCGTAGVTLLSDAQMQLAQSAQVAIDLNAVPPAGLAGIAATDKAVRRGERIDYGAVGVGGLKMKIHRAAIQSLFASNDRFLDTEEIFDLGKALEEAS